MKTLNNTIEFFKKVKNDMKRAYALTKAKAESPRVLGARPRETAITAKAYPSLPTDIEETMETRSNRTVSWMIGTKPPADIKGNIGTSAAADSNNETVNGQTAIQPSNAVRLPAFQHRTVPISLYCI